MRRLDLADIQGGILRGYGRNGFPKARYFFANIREADKGRRFVEQLIPRITTASRWVDPHRGAPLVRGHRPKVTDVIRFRAGVADYPGHVRLVKPKVAINVGFSFLGLLALEVATRTLRGMPDEFIDGMERRAAMLGDAPFLGRRDAVWRDAAGPRAVHLMVSMNAEMDAAGHPVAELDEATQWLRALCGAAEGAVALLSGVSPDNDDFQAMSAVLSENGGVLSPTNREHFGLSDGFGDPAFEGQLGPKGEKIKAVGGGKLLGAGKWAPLATGEFLLGYPDEAQEIAGAAMPIEFSRNGTFMTYRKLHENVGSFSGYLKSQAGLYAAATGLAPNDALAALSAKLVGRWPDGVPLMAAPDVAAWRAFQAAQAKAQAAGDQPALAAIALKYVDFTYAGDPDGAACPLASHLRRGNTRDMLDPGFAANAPKGKAASVLNNRRRILRRGLPYGEVDADNPTDAGEHGIVFMAVCASLFRQFEFVQQQWMQYGLDFNVGSDTCPIIGNHDPGAKYVVPVKPDGTDAPFICDGLPQFVEPRGGEYFFLPSMTALRMIAMGIVDPT